MAKRRKTNYFYSIISVALVLFLLGFFGTALLFVRQQAAMQQEKITMMVEIKEGADSAALASLKKELPKMDFVKTGSVHFVSKQEAADVMRQSLGDTLINPDMPLPFYDAYSLSLKPESMNKNAAINAKRAIFSIVLDTSPNKPSSIYTSFTAKLSFNF